jgi:arsenate reductase (glutaredoxin)
MSTIRFFGYRKCSSCAKAERLLKEAKVSYEFMDITENPPSLLELKQMLQAKGDPKLLFNTSGQAYREGKIAEKLPSLDPEEKLSLLAKNGRLVKRPFLLVKEKGVALLGFKEPEWKSALKALT